MSKQLITLNLSLQYPMNYCYSDEISESLVAIAKDAEIYNHIWNPKKVGVFMSDDLIEPLEKGLVRLKGNSDNTNVYNGFIHFVEGYITFCKEHPGSFVAID
jgi:hypothetical protein